MSPEKVAIWLICAVFAKSIPAKIVKGNDGTKPISKVPLAVCLFSTAEFVGFSTSSETRGR